MSPRVSDVLSRIVLLAGAVAAVATSCPEPLCDDDEECLAVCERGLEMAAQSDEEIANAPPAELTATGCYLAWTALVREEGDEDVSERPNCDCEPADGLPYTLFGDFDYCLVPARNGRCLLDAAELPFDLCVPDDAATCIDVCADLEARLAADAARVIDRSLVGTECSFDCDCVVDVDGRCFRSAWTALERFRPDGEIPCP